MMVKKAVSLILCLWLAVSVLSFGVCATTDQPEVPDWGVTLFAQDVTPTGMKLVTNQKGGNYAGTLEYDTCFHLQYLQDGEWQWVPELISYACPLNADSVWLHGSWWEELNWENHYGTLAPGHYRLVREFIEFGESNIRMDLFAEFVITDQHVCLSNDGDMLCDRCLGLLKHRSQDSDSDGCCDVCGNCDTYRVVGSAEWMGLWDPASLYGLMGRGEDGIYRTVFTDVPAGSYEFKITKNGIWDDAIGDEGRNIYLSVSKKCDVTVELILFNGKEMVRFYGPPMEWDEDDIPEENPKTADLSLGLPAALLLIGSATLLILLRKSKKIQ